MFTFGLEAEPAAPGDEPVLAVPESGTAAHMAWLLGDLASSRLEGERFVALRPERIADPALRRFELLRSTLFRSTLGVHATPLPPLAARVLAGLAAVLARKVAAPGLLMAALPRLERELTVLARLDRVTGLRHPAPSVSQHAASMLPGSAFGVVLGEEPVVKRLSGRDSTLPVPRPSGPSRVLVAGRTHAPGWVEEFVASLFASNEVEDVEVPEEATEAWWGTKKVVELVAHPTDLSALAARVAGRRRGRPCEWCGATVAKSPCPFCRQVQLRRPSAPAEAA